MEMNYLAVLVGAVAGFLLGGIWYSHKVFGLIWNREAGRGREAHQPHPLHVYGVSFLFALITITALAFLLGPLPALATALQQALLLGACIAATSLGITYQFANLSFTMFLIDGGYHVARFLLYALILGLWH